MAIEITVAIPGTARVGESPCWDAGTGTLSWVDIMSGTVYRSDLSSPAQTVVELPIMVGAAAPKASGGFVTATARGFADIDPGGRVVRQLDVLPDGVRMNDAKCDPAGRFWAGGCALDFATGQGSLHVLQPDWTTEEVFSGLTQPNGLGWSPDGATFYLIDTQARQLTAYDVVPGQVVPAAPRVLKRFPVPLGYPDGLTVDADGGLWVAMWGGGRILHLSPSGRVIDELPMPVAQPSSCVFGGPELDVLYVTSATEGMAVGPDDPSGSVFAVTGLGVRGLPSQRFGG
jgi:sugar lactone lactonase YvrE